MNKHAPLLAILLALGNALPGAPTGAAPLELWVAPGGADTDSGSVNAPLSSVAEALTRIRRLGPTGGARVILRGGMYPLIAPLVIRTSDCPGYGVTIEAAPGETPVLSGGTEIRNWTRLPGTGGRLPTEARGNLWVAEVPKAAGAPRNFRQLWINGHKAIRAREPNGKHLARLVAWDKTNEVAVVPAVAPKGITDPDNLEMVVDQVWEIAVLRVKSIRYAGTNAWIRFAQPEGSLEFEHPWPPVTVTAKYQAPFYLANAPEFLDQPGEWFEDLSDGRVYYWPRKGEDMATATVIAPAIETLVQVAGAPESPVKNLYFKGITFAYTTWLRPSQQGHVPLQAGMFLLDAKKLRPKGTPYHPGLDNLAWIGRPPAAVCVENAADISFENCTMEHVASGGLDFERGVRDSLVQGCVFRDIGGNGIQLGHFSDTNIETHVPYAPSNEDELCARDRIANNLIADCGCEDWGCVGIAVGYAQNIVVEHNLLFDLPYTGISVGWGWTKMTNASRNNTVRANRIFRAGERLGDLGGIYLLSAQPGTVVEQNCISDLAPSPYVPDPEHWYYLYLDEGSSFITVRDNWCPAQKILKNANGPGNVWTNNGPEVSDAIKDAAGLEPRFRHLETQLP
jgi:hypothetical protein